MLAALDHLRLYPIRSLKSPPTFIRSTSTLLFSATSTIPRVGPRITRPPRAALSNIFIRASPRHGAPRACQSLRWIAPSWQDHQRRDDRSFIFNPSTTESSRHEKADVRRTEEISELQIFSSRSENVNISVYCRLPRTSSIFPIPMAKASLAREILPLIPTVRRSPRVESLRLIFLTRYSSVPLEKRVPRVITTCQRQGNSSRTGNTRKIRRAAYREQDLGVRIINEYPLLESADGTGRPFSRTFAKYGASCSMFAALR